MSYSCKISFKKIKPEEIMDFFVEFKKCLKENIKDIAKKNYCYCPFIRKTLVPAKDFKDIKPNEIIEAKNWAFNVFKFRYFYNKELGLLGVYGIPESVEKLFDGSVYFQNSCDQDYSEKEWGGIEAFNNIYQKWMNTEDDKIKGLYNEKYGCGTSFDEDYSENERQNKLLYWKQTFCYDEIWEKIKDTLYNDAEAIYFYPFGYYEEHYISAFINYCYNEFKERYADKKKNKEHSENNIAEEER